MTEIVQANELDLDSSAEAVLCEMVAIVVARREDRVSHVYSVSDRIKAATTALPYLKAKPESSVAIRAETATDFFRLADERRKAKELAAEQKIVEHSPGVPVGD